MNTKLLKTLKYVFQGYMWFSRDPVDPRRTVYVVFGISAEWQGARHFIVQKKQYATQRTSSSTIYIDRS